MQMVNAALLRHVAALVAYTALTVVLTWPLSTQLGRAVPQDLGDPLLSTWTLWWNAAVGWSSIPWAVAEFRAFMN